MKRAVLGIMILLFYSNSVLANDIIATWMYNNGNSMELSYRDNTHIRMDTSQQGYMLLTKDKMYMITRQEGQWQAIDMDQMAGMMQSFGQNASQNMQDDIENIPDELKDSGRTEVVAGYKGKVYLIQEEQSDGSLKEVEIVLSTHPDIKKINQGWLALSNRMGKMMGEEMAQSIKRATEKSDKEKLGGLLRYEDIIKLNSVKKKKLEDDFFKLPEEITMVQMPQFSVQDANNNANTAPAANQSKNIPQKSQNTDQDASDALKEEINKGVRSLFEKLF
ncbi:MAG: hypothetical protein PVI90_11145 [Desulfobacteraceae bacterium]